MERGKALSTMFMLLPRQDESKIEREALFIGTVSSGEVKGYGDGFETQGVPARAASFSLSGTAFFRPPVLGHGELCRI